MSFIFRFDSVLLNDVEPMLTTVPFKFTLVLFTCYGNSRKRTNPSPVCSPFNTVQLLYSLYEPPPPATPVGLTPSSLNLTPPPEYPPPPPGMYVQAPPPPKPPSQLEYDEHDPPSPPLRNDLPPWTQNFPVHSPEVWHWPFPWYPPPAPASLVPPDKQTKPPAMLFPPARWGDARVSSWPGSPSVTPPPPPPPATDIGLLLGDARATNVPPPPLPG